MQKLAELCVRRPVFATVLILALVVVGAFSYIQLGVDRFPNVDFPFVTITTVLPGAAPEEMETEITDKIEEAVNTISGIDELFSTSSENVSLIQIQFALEKNGDVAAQEVRDKVNSILADLPQDADPPIIEKFDADSDPVISIALSGPAASATSPSSPTRSSSAASRRSTASARCAWSASGRGRSTSSPIPAKLSSLGLTSADVVAALGTQNVQIPGGRSSRAGAT